MIRALTNLLSAFEVTSP